MRLRHALALLAAPALIAGDNPPDPAPSIISELNRVRSDPRGYADELMRFRPRYVGRIVRDPGETVDRLTFEGASALDDAVAFLRRQPREAALATFSPLALAAADHVRKQGPSGVSGHVEADGATPLDRIARRGMRPYVVGEVISYGPRDAAAVVRELIIDDGVRDRGHRFAIFNTDFARAGAACGAHRRYGIMCVVNFASATEAPMQARLLR